MRAALAQPSSRRRAPPPSPTAEAVAALGKDPRLPAPFQPFAALLALALPHALSDDDTGVLQAAYIALLSTLQGSPTGPPPGPHTTPAASAGRFVMQDGRQVYVSKKGRYCYDTSLPPPFPCRYCQGLLWNWMPCSATPVRQYPQQPCARAPGLTPLPAYPNFPRREPLLAQPLPGNPAAFHSH